MELSGNARKLQDEEIERLVKCRVRSEIEARKAVEATMKRAVQEARELKKELMVMRQEKEELTSGARKATMAAATTPTPGGVVTKEDLQKKLTQEKAKHKELTKQLQQTQQELTDLQEYSEQQTNEHAAVNAQRDDAARKSHEELQRRQREVETLQDEAKRLKTVADEAKRKCQRAVKDKKEELQQLMDENAQLHKRCEAAERLADENAKLRKHLDKIKDKQSGVGDEWQRKLDQREQAFLRQEQDNKQLLMVKQQEITALEEINEELRAKIQECEAAAKATARRYEAQLERETHKFQELLVSSQQLQERLQTLKDAGRVADRARLEADARLAKEEQRRETAEKAADAVEARALKTEQQLGETRQQLELLDKALKKKGITIEYLLKQSGSSSGSSQSTKRTVSAKKQEEPEENELSSLESVATRPLATKKKTTSPATTTISTSASPSCSAARDKTKSTVAAVLPSSSRSTLVAGAKTMLTKPKPLLSTATRDPRGYNNNATSNQSEREHTPERVRK